MTTEIRISDMGKQAGRSQASLLELIGDELPPDNMVIYSLPVSITGSVTKKQRAAA